MPRRVLKKTSHQGAQKFLSWRPADAGMTVLFLNSALLFLLLSFPSYSLELSGTFEQGGILYGRTDPEAIVTIDGTPTKVSEDGRFLFGLHRHHPETSVVEATLMGGIAARQEIQVKQRRYQTQKITGVLNRHVNPFAEDLPQIRSDKKKINAARAVFENLPFVFGRFQLPVENLKVTGVYGSNRTYNGEERNWHKGVDFAAPTGTPVYAPAAGVVRLALENSFFNGNIIIVDHGHQLMTVYAHLDHIDVQKGMPVKTGDLLGKIGSTGRSTGPHLHWGAYWRNMALDPLLLLEHKPLND